MDWGNALTTGTTCETILQLHPGSNYFDVIFQKQDYKTFHIRFCVYKTDYIFGENQNFRQFVLNTKRFSAENPVLYSTGGAKIADVSAQYGDLADKVYVTPDGLHVSGDTRAAFPVDLPASGNWTIIYRIKDYMPINSHPGCFVHHLFDSSDRHLETAYVSNWDSHALHFRLIENRNGNYTLFSGSRISTHQGFYDDAVRLSDLQYYQLEYRWINDGVMLSFYVNGVKKAAISTENWKIFLNCFLHWILTQVSMKIRLL